MTSVPIPSALPAVAPVPPTTGTEKIPSFEATVVKAIRELSRVVKFALIALLLVLLVAVYIWMGRVSTDDAEVDAHITAVASQVSGYVVGLPIDDNVNVESGDVLLQIDPREYQTEVDQAKATLDLAEAEANSAKLQIGLTRSTTTRSTEGAAAQRESDAADLVISEAQL